MIHAVFASAAALALPAVANAQFQLVVRSIDGHGNNVQHPDWGVASAALLRLESIDHGGGVGSPAGAGRQNVRTISNAVCAQSARGPDARGASDMLWQWGQFIDHDLDLSETAMPLESFAILVPRGDPQFDPHGTGTQVMPVFRSEYVMQGAPAVRQQTNDILAFLDGSMVYGSDPARANEFRSLDGTGRLKTSAGNLLPFNTSGFANAPNPNDPTLFLAGDVRANEQNALTAMHTLFVRGHNNWAVLIGLAFPAMSGEDRYQLARAIVIGEIQAITYREWLPVLLGPTALPAYQGYDPNVDPGIRNVFSTAAFRLGHTMLSPTLRRLDADLRSIPQGDLPLRSAFFEPDEIVATGIEPLLRGLVRQHAQEVDPEIIDDVRNFLFGPPGSGGFDLAWLNIQRGRDHGLPSYNQLRADVGLVRRTRFDEISSDPALCQRLATVYANVDEIDLRVGALAEDHVPQAMVGELLFEVLKDQFERIRDGDRFWYEGYLPAPMVAFVEQQSLADAIRRNTSIGVEIQDDAFVLNGSVIDLGGGCGGDQSTSGGAPSIGNAAFSLELRGAASDASVAAIVFAVGPDPALLGCGPCEALVGQFGSGTIGLTGGAGSFGISIPTDPLLVRTELHTQWIVLTPTAPPCAAHGVSVSNRILLTLGG